MATGDATPDRESTSEEADDSLLGDLSDILSDSSEHLDRVRSHAKTLNILHAQDSLRKHTAEHLLSQYKVRYGGGSSRREGGSDAQDFVHRILPPSSSMPLPLETSPEQLAMQLVEQFDWDTWRAETRRPPATRGSHANDAKWSDEEKRKLLQLYDSHWADVEGSQGSHVIDRVKRDWDALSVSQPNVYRPRSRVAMAKKLQRLHAAHSDRRPTGTS